MGTPRPHPPGLYFPPPPPRSGPVPSNPYGIARIVAPTLGVDHYVEVLGVTNGMMDSPNDGSYAVGYYPDFSQVPGDEVFIEMTDGRRLRYRIMTSTRYDVESIPMAEVIWPTRRHVGEQWLT